MMPPSLSPYTIISEDASHILRLVQQPWATALQHFSDQGCEQVSLDDAERHAVLCALPRAALVAALAAQQVAPSLAQHHDCPGCGLCTTCLPCACPPKGDQRMDPTDLPILSEWADPPAPHPGIPPALANPGAWWRPLMPGQVCACDRHAGVHVADAVCTARQGTTGQRTQEGKA